MVLKNPPLFHHHTRISDFKVPPNPRVILRGYFGCTKNSAGCALRNKIPPWVIYPLLLDSPTARQTRDYELASKWPVSGSLGVWVSSILQNSSRKFEQDKETIERPSEIRQYDNIGIIFVDLIDKQK